MDVMEMLLLACVFAAVVILPFIHALTPWLDSADYSLPSWAVPIGAVVAGASLWLFHRAHSGLGDNWSPTLEVRKEQRLITGGVYRRVRHPMYASQTLWGISQVTLLQNWVAGLAGMGISLLLYLVRIPREERMMLERFGEEYRSYMRRTGRLLPQGRSGSLPYSRSGRSEAP